MSKKLSGCDALTKTMIAQHGIDKSILLAKHQIRTCKNDTRESIWAGVVVRLINIRTKTRGH